MHPHCSSSTSSSSVHSLALVGRHPARLLSQQKRQVDGCAGALQGMQAGRVDVQVVRDACEECTFETGWLCVLGGHTLTVCMPARLLAASPPAEQRTSIKATAAASSAASSLEAGVSSAAASRSSTEGRDRAAAAVKRGSGARRPGRQRCRQGCCASHGAASCLQCGLTCSTASCWCCRAGSRAGTARVGEASAAMARRLTEVGQGNMQLSMVAFVCDLASSALPASSARPMQAAAAM